MFCGVILKTALFGVSVAGKLHCVARREYFVIFGGVVGSVVGRGGEFSASLRHSRRYLRWLDSARVGDGAAAKVVIVLFLKWIKLYVCSIGNI